jgi:hypothetical protein
MEGQINNTQNNARTSRNIENSLKDNDNKEPQNMRKGAQKQKQAKVKHFNMQDK